MEEPIEGLKDKEETFSEAKKGTTVIHICFYYLQSFFPLCNLYLPYRENK